jgi:hypothetical protein
MKAAMKPSVALKPAAVPLRLESAHCRKLQFLIHQSGYARVNQHRSNFYSGSVLVDCPTQAGGEVKGTVTFSDC